MSDELEKTVKNYGNIMELCLTEASRITSTASIGDNELRGQITHDLFVAATGESAKAAELDILAKLKEGVDGFHASSYSPFPKGLAEFAAEEAKRREDSVPFEPDNGE